MLKSSVNAFDELAERLAESDKALGVVCAEVPSLKEQMVRADTEKTDSEKIVADMSKESEKHIVDMNVALVCGDLAERLTSLLVTIAVNTFDAFVQQFQHDAVNRLRHCWKGFI